MGVRRSGQGAAQLHKTGHRTSSVGYRRASVLCHWVLFVLAVWLRSLVGAFFGLALSRAWLLPGTDLRPKQVGIVEIVLSVLLVVVIVAVW